MLCINNNFCLTDGREQLSSLRLKCTVALELKQLTKPSCCSPDITVIVQKIKANFSFDLTTSIKAVLKKNPQNHMVPLYLKSTRKILF